MPPPFHGMTGASGETKCSGNIRGFLLARGATGELGPDEELEGSSIHEQLSGIKCSHGSLAVSLGRITSLAAHPPHPGLASLRESRRVSGLQEQPP